MASKNENQIAIRFNRLLEAMALGGRAKKPAPKSRTSKQASSANYGGTQTPSNKKKGASPKRGRKSP